MSLNACNPYTVSLNHYPGFGKLTYAVWDDPQTGEEIDLEAWLLQSHETWTEADEDNEDNIKPETTSYILGRYRVTEDHCINELGEYFSYGLLDPSVRNR